MAEHGVRPRGENGAKALAVKRKTRVSNRKDPAVKTVQPTSSYRATDTASRIAKRSSQLLKRNDSMLPRCKVRKSPPRSRVRRSFVPHRTPKVRRTLVLPAFGLSWRYEHEKSRRPWAGGFANRRCA